MKLVHFTRYDGKGTIAFVANKIFGFTEHAPGYTSIYCGETNYEGEFDEFIVRENFRQVVSIMEQVKED